MIENEEITITFDGKTYVVTSWQWQNNDFHFTTTTGESICLKNAVAKDLKYAGLESNQSESAILGNGKRWNSEGI